MAKVVEATAFGGPEVLTVVDEPVPAPGPGEVTIRVLATEVTWAARYVVHKPARLSSAEASGLLLTGSTAVHALTATGVRTGDTLLLHGAAGSLGRHVAQLALVDGAEVIGTASPGRHDE